MTTQYKFTQDELESFAKTVYDKACYGYMDLKESTCNLLVLKFIEGRQVSINDTNITELTNSSCYGLDEIWSYRSDSGLGIHGMYGTYGGNHSMCWEVDTSQLRSEDYVRLEQNYQQ